MQAVCLASGPSLTQEDVDLVKGWRDNTPDGFVIAANTTFRIAPWADAMFAMDPKWWKVHYREVCDVFEGERFTTATLDSRFALTRLDRFSNYRNSGAACIALAAMKGADRIVMLGYDCMKDGDKAHWHGSHPAGMSDAKTVALWPVIFDRLAKDMRRKGVQVVNASRRTALKCFPRMDLDECLEENWNAADRFAAENRIP